MSAPILDVVKSWQPLADLLTTTDGTLKVFPDMALFDTPRPYIVYAQVAKDPIAPYAAIPDADYDRFTFDCWANERDDAMTLAGMLRDAFDHYIAGVRPYGYLVAGFQETFDPEARAYVVAFDWGIWTQRGGPPLQRPSKSTT